MSSILFFLTRNLPMRCISENYNERYYLFSAFGYRAYIHRFVGSDPANECHSHPWRKAWSFVLSGFYWEERQDSTGKPLSFERVKWFNKLDGDTFHRVQLQTYMEQDCNPNGTWRRSFSRRYIECWTLFIHTTPDVKPWGFLRQNADTGRAEFQPYLYEREGDQSNWWKGAKSRKQTRGSTK